MKRISILLAAGAICVLSSAAQLFNFSLRTNNQQLIDRALQGAFVKVVRGYELCDTVSGERFGSDGNDSFSLFYYSGIKTTRGIILPTLIETPWEHDPYFEPYRAEYKPQINSTHIQTYNLPDSLQEVDSPAIVPVNDRWCILTASDLSSGLEIDSIAGAKEGWMVWTTSAIAPTEADSIKLTSIPLDIEVAASGQSITLENPNLDEKIVMGYYLTPIQNAVGQLTFHLTGIASLIDNEWILEFPFIREKKETKQLTPKAEQQPLNSLKKKKK